MPRRPLVKLVRPFAFLFLLTIAASASAAPPPFPNGTLRGTVKEQESGAPVAGARLHFYDQTRSERGSAVTNEGGYFSSASLLGGSYYVFVERSGDLAPQVYDGLPCIRRSYDRFTCDFAAATRVIASIDNSDFTVTMRRGATFRGRVTDRATGAPLAGVFVDLLSSRLDDLEIYTQTDGDGRFAIAGIPPGEYYLETSLTSYPVQLWPNVPCISRCDEEKSLATLISVTADEVRDDLDFALGAYGKVQGSVRDRRTGLPIDGASIGLHRADLPADVLGNIGTEADGHYERDRVPPVAYYVVAGADGYRTQVHRGVELADWQADPGRGERVVVPPGGEAQVSFELVPLPALRVRVVLPAGGNACTLVIWRKNADGSIEQAATESCYGGGERKYYVPGAGTYLLAARGDFASTLLGAGSCYFDELRNYCDFYRATPIAVGADEVVPIEIRPEAAATLRATARDAATRESAPAIFVLADSAGRRLFENDGGSGETRFDHLPPGRYYLAALGVPGHGNQVYPGVACGRFWCDPLAGQPIELAAGADGSAAFELAALTATTCSETATRLCVQQDRFEIVATWQDFLAAEGDARLFPLGSESGYAYFFSPGNVELMVKVLNACSPQLGEHFWVFAAGLTNVAVRLEVTDTWTGLKQTYENPLGTPFAPIFDTTTFATCGAPEPDGITLLPPLLRAAALSAKAGPATAQPVFCQSPSNCIAGRYRPAVLFTRPGELGPGTGLSFTLTPETKAYTFFSADNYEVLIKVLDACDSTGHFWFFAAGLTDLPVTILLQDQATGRTFTFESPGGRPFEPILDFTSLSCYY